MRLRPPATPLITIDPYFSVWTDSNELNSKYTIHWTGKEHSIKGHLIVDGTAYRFMGAYDQENEPTLKQVSSDMDALTTTYVFEGAGIELTALFTSPILPYDFYYLSRPVSYLELIVRSTDGGESFFRHGYISVPDGSKVWEPNAVELSPGHLIMYMRCSGALAGCLYVSESFDYGRTWTAAEPTELLNADTKVTLLKVRDKVVLINNFDIKYRKHLSIAVSTDGKNFEKVAEVEDGLESWYYPHAFADDARELLYVAYENKHEHWLKKYSYAELGI